MRILLTLAAAGFVFMASAQATPTTKITVNGMVCAFCAQGIEKKLTALPQTRAVYVDLGEKIVAVEAREGQTIDVDKVRAEIKDAGYDVVKVESVEQSVEELRAAAAKAKKK